MKFSFTSGLMEPDVLRKVIRSGYSKLEPLLNRAKVLRPGKAVLQDEWTSAQLVSWMVESLVEHADRALCLIRKAKDLRRFIIYTYDAQALASVAKSPDFAELFEHPAVKIFLLDQKQMIDAHTCLEALDPGLGDDLSDLRLFTDMKSVDNAQLYVNRFLFAHSQLHYLPILADLPEAIMASLKDATLGLYNSIRNMGNWLGSPDLRNARELFHDTPAVLVGAGPSASSQLSWLREHQESCLVIAADTMTTPLRKAGITPDVVTAVERVPEIIKLLELDRDHDRTLLCGSPVLDPTCISDYRGPISISPHVPGLAHWFSFGRMGFTGGSSCIGLSLCLAQLFGCPTVYLMGIDLCRGSEGQPYAADVVKLKDKAYLREDSFLREKGLIEASNSRGDPVQTHSFWLRFKRQFERQIATLGRPVYNLSPSGLPLNGALNMDLAEVKFPSRSAGAFDRLINALPYTASPPTADSLYAYIRRTRTAVVLLQILREQLETATPKEALKLIKSNPLFDLLLYDILFVATIRLGSDRTELSQAALKSINTLMPYLIQVVAESISIAQEVLRCHNEESFELY